MPTRQALIEAIGTDVDPDRVDAAHQGLSAALGAKMSDTLAKLYAAPIPPADDVSAEAAGHRALRNAAMHLLAAAGDTDRAVAQATSATTMTDRLAALGALAFADAPEADDALASFARAYDHEPLVLDKYFAMEAMRPDDDALDRGAPPDGSSRSSASRRPTGCAASSARSRRTSPRSTARTAKATACRRCGQSARQVESAGCGAPVDVVRGRAAVRCAAARSGGGRPRRSASNGDVVRRGSTLPAG